MENKIESPQTISDNDIKKKAKSMLESPDLFNQIVQDVQALGVAGEENLIKTIYLIGVSRLLDRPLAGIVQASSSSGKSYVVSTTIKLFPSEVKLIATHITPQALYYLDQGSLKNKLVVVGERSRRDDDDAAEATLALREMLSEQKLSKVVTIRIGGNHEAKKIEQEGPIAYIETTTKEKIFDEDLNRCLLLATDETPEQTRRIMIQTAKHNEGKKESSERENIIAKHHTLQLLLFPKPVKIPYATHLAELFPGERLTARRAFPHMLNMIRSHVLLHQYQRAVDEEGNLIAIAEDYRIVRELLAIPFSRTLGKRISEGAGRFLQHLLTKRLLADKKCPIIFSISEIEDFEGKTQKTLRNYLKELSTAGYVVETTPSNGRNSAQWTVVKETVDDSDLVNLPSEEDVCRK
jgi:DNA primase